MRIGSTTIGTRKSKELEEMQMKFIDSTNAWIRPVENHMAVREASISTTSSNIRKFTKPYPVSMLRIKMRKKIERRTKRKM